MEGSIGTIDVSSQLKLKHLDGAYTFTDKDAATAFLETHPQVTDLLDDALGPLRQAFPDARFTIRVDGVPNPGLEESPEALLVTIWTTTDPLGALNCLHRFYDNWNRQEANGQLCFDVSFA